MANDYVALATITLTGTDTEIVFGSIPSSYRDLIVVVEGVPSARTDEIRLRFNADTGNNYAWVEAGGNGSVTYSGGTSGTSGIIAGYLTTAARIAMVLQIMDYSATDKHKTALVRQSAASEAVVMRAGRWSNTAAVTSVSLTCQSSNFATGSTFSLYGIRS